MMTTTHDEQNVTDDMLTPRSGGGELTVTDPQDALPQRIADYDEFEAAVKSYLNLTDANEGEMRLFHHLCVKSGLDPFNKEIYMIGRPTKVKHTRPNPRDPDGEPQEYVTTENRYATQVAINGFRKRARKLADLKGVDLEMGEPMWCGDDGVWKEVWIDKRTPVAAKFVVWRDKKPYSFVAHYDEFVQLTQGGEANSVWKKMPRNQLRKCAEANALQMAFPDELGGLVLDVAAQHDIIDAVDTPASAPVSRSAQRSRGVGGLRDAADADDDDDAYDTSREPSSAFGGLGGVAATIVAEPAQDDDTRDTPERDALISKDQQQELKTLMDALCIPRPRRREYVKTITGHDGGADDLTQAAHARLVSDLELRNKLDVAFAAAGFDNPDEQGDYIAVAINKDVTDILDLSTDDVQKLITALESDA